MKFKERIQKLRKKANRRHRETAERVGIATVQYQQYEYGYLDNPCLATLRKFAKCYGLTLSQLLKGVK